MLLLLFYVGNELYALDSSQVVEIIPRVLLRKVNYSPNYVAGVFNYRGTIVPVIDLCHLIQGHPSRSHLSTRIVMVSYQKDGVARCMGLMAERVTETLRKSDAELANAGTQLDDSPPYLGEMIMDEKGMIQRIRLEFLLSDTQHHQIFMAGNYASINGAGKH